MNKVFFAIIGVAPLVGGMMIWKTLKNTAPEPVVTNFTECAAEGNPIMESYPRQCRHGNETFVEGIATAKGDWMTAEFVPYEAKLLFAVDPDAYSDRGTLILKKSNASGLPEHDDAIEIPVVLR